MKRIFFPVVAFVFLFVLAACGKAASPQQSEGGTIIIFHAGSLTVPIQQLTEAFRQEHPNVRFQTEAGGSRAVARKVSELGKPADLVFAADYTVIDQLLVPKFASWNIKFARNTMVLAYTERSKYADEITPDNWYKILLRDGVVYGHSDPNADPCGYRTLMVWQLAEKFYKVPGLYSQLADHCPASNVRPKAVELLALLQSGDMDYAFEYRSVAVQHNLKFVELPPQINLGDPKYADFYAQAKVEVSGTKPGTTITKVGAPIIYGVTIPKNAPHPDLAVDFLRFVLSQQGQKILEQAGQPPLVPPQAEHPELLPSALRPLFSQNR